MGGGSFLSAEIESVLFYNPSRLGDECLCISVCTYVHMSLLKRVCVYLCVDKCYIITE